MRDDAPGLARLHGIARGFRPHRPLRGIGGQVHVHRDWEVELGVVIGKACKYVSEAEAMDHVLGYCVINDLSEREYQLERAGQWVKGKSADTFGPIGRFPNTRW